MITVMCIRLHTPADRVDGICPDLGDFVRSPHPLLHIELGAIPHRDLPFHLTLQKT